MTTDRSDSRFGAVVAMVTISKELTPSSDVDVADVRPMSSKRGRQLVLRSAEDSDQPADASRGDLQRAQ